MNPEKKQEAAVGTLNRFYKEEAAYLAAGGGDFSAIAATLDPECVIFQPASLPYGGEWRGHAGFETWMKAFVQQWSSMEVQNTELFPHGDVIISKSHVYARSRVSGQIIDWPLLQFFKLRDFKILELWPFYWDTAAILPKMRGGEHR